MAKPKRRMTEAEADSAMNANLAKAIVRTNRDKAERGPGPVAGSGLLKKARNLIGNATGRPEGTPAWRERQEKIDRSRAKVRQRRSG